MFSIGVGSEGRIVDVAAIALKNAEGRPCWPTGFFPGKWPVGSFQRPRPHALHADIVVNILFDQGLFGLLMFASWRLRPCGAFPSAGPARPLAPSQPGGGNRRPPYGRHLRQPARRTAPRPAVLPDDPDGNDTGGWKTAAQTRKTPPCPTRSLIRADQSLLVSGSYFPGSAGFRMMAEICAHLGSDHVSPPFRTGMAPTRSAPHRLRTTIPERLRRRLPHRLAHFALLWAGHPLARAPHPPQFAGWTMPWIGWYTTCLLRLPHLIYAHGSKLALARSTWRSRWFHFAPPGPIIANSRFLAKPVEKKNWEYRAAHPHHPSRLRYPAPPACRRSRRLAPAPRRRENAFCCFSRWATSSEPQGHDLVLRPGRAAATLSPHRLRHRRRRPGPGQTRAPRPDARVADCVNFLGRGDDADLATWYSALRPVRHALPRHPGK